MNIYSLIAINAFIGISGAGFTLTLFCSLLEMLPENKKTIYTSFFNTFINISGFIAPLIGIWVYSRLGIYHAFLLIGILRVLASMFFIARWWTGRRKYKLTCKKSPELEV
jgi:MFS family permease